MSARLLLVEDEDEARLSLARSLGRAHYEVRAVPGRAEALEELERGFLPEYIVTDLVLGQEKDGGLQLLAECRRRSLGSQVVLITAFASVDRLKEGLNQGADFLLEKPFRAQELLEVLANLKPRARDLEGLVMAALAPAGLTEKELAIALLLLKGLPSSEIARLEGNSDKTVRQHITRVYQKCGVASRPEFFHFVFPF